jgi:hypothetical protein
VASGDPNHFSILAARYKAQRQSAKTLREWSLEQVNGYIHNVNDAFVFVMDR